MEIEIKNYSGISSLKYNVEEEKINFLFGISGSGKSSIACALTDNDASSHVKVGKSVDDLEVTVDSNPTDYTYFKVFNLKYLDDILISKVNGNDIYTILVGDEGKIGEYRNNYNNAISDLLLVKTEIINELAKLSTLVSELKLSTVKKGKDFSSSSLNKKMEINAMSLPSYRNAITYNSSQIKWMKDGTNMPPYSRNVCPFCSSKISLSRKAKINQILIFDSKTYEKINRQTAIFDSLNLNMPDWLKKREVNAFNKKLLRYFDVKKELEMFNSYIDVASKLTLDSIYIKLERPSKNLKEYYPSIASAIDLFNSKIVDIRKAFGKLKSETQNVINANCEKINEKMEILGIPYRFVKQEIDEENKSATYIIAHIDEDESGKDRASNLSFGEKNLIALVFFLIANAKSKGLIIDDPASSFDDYRRKAIFDLIYDLHDKSTMLVLSHDSVFVKYAVFHLDDSQKLHRQHLSMSKLKTKFLIETGKIDFIESYIDSNIIPISLNDFDVIENFVLDRLKVLDQSINYQTAINLRILFELKKRKNPILYSYLSAIIHKTSYEEIMALLASKGKTETDLLNDIFAVTSIMYSPLKSTYISDINTFTYVDFEKIVKCRELINYKVKKDKVVKDELSNIIHMSSSYAICLNPYKFNYFSKYVKNYIESH